MTRSSFEEIMAPGVRFAAKAARHIAKRHADEGEEWAAVVLESFAGALEDQVKNWKVLTQ